MLLDPLEEKFDLPPWFIESGDGCSGECKIVCDEHQTLLCFRITIYDASNNSWIVFAWWYTGECYRLIDNDTFTTISMVRIDAFKLCILFWSSDKERTSFFNPKESSEVEITTIHDIDSSWLEMEIIEDVHIMQITAWNKDYRGDVASKIQQRMHLYRCFRSSKLCPWEER